MNYNKNVIVITGQKVKVTGWYKYYSHADKKYNDDSHRDFCEEHSELLRCLFREGNIVPEEICKKEVKYVLVYEDEYELDQQEYELDEEGHDVTKPTFWRKLFNTRWLYCYINIEFDK